MTATFFLSREQVRQVDQRCFTEFSIRGNVLMENAGRGCAELLMRLNPNQEKICILCGPGNNGGDGFVIARHLDNAGWPVEVRMFAETGQYSDDSGGNHNAVQAAGIELKEYPWDLDFTGFGWIVDALFGTGLSRPLNEDFSNLVEKIKASKLSVLSVDIPSGLDCDTGEPLGIAVHASHTATFVAPKLGFTNPNSHPFTGQIHTIDIGAPRKLIEDYR